MITLTSTGLPASAPVSVGGGPVTTIDTGEAIAAAPLVTISLTGSEVEAIASTTLPSYSGDVVVVAVPPVDSQEVDTVSNVVVGGVAYQEFEQTPEAIGTVTATSTATVGDVTTVTETTNTGVTLATGTNNSTGAVSVVITPPLGTYTYSPSSQEITLYVDEDNPPPQSAPVTYVAVKSQGSRITDDYLIKLPRLIRKWNANGVVSTTRLLERSPSGTFTFSATESDLDSICSDFKTGTPLVINEHGYAVESISIEGMMSSLETTDRIQVTVQLQGIHDTKLETVVKLRASRNTTSTTLSTIADRAGLTYSGPEVQVKIDKETPLRTGTTVQTELARSRVVRGFAFYSHPDRIEIRQWGKTTVHKLGKRDILNDVANPITTQRGGGAIKLDGTLLSEEYQNTELNIDTQDNTEGSNGRKNITQVIKGGTLAKASVIVNGNLPSDTDLSTPQNAFDLGGPTTNLSFITKVNGVEVSRTNTVYGYAYATSDTLTINQQTVGSITTYQPFYNPLQSRTIFQKAIKEEASESIFDDDGYLIQEINTITDLTRYQQESATEQEAYEALVFESFYVNSNMDAATLSTVRGLFGLKKASYATFFGVISEDITTYTNLEYRDYYPDIPEPSDGDPEPKFMASKRRSHSRTNNAPNIQNDIDRLEAIAAGSVSIAYKVPLLTGVSFQEDEEVVINYPTPGTSSSTYQQGLDNYQVDRDVRNAEGEQLRNSAESKTTEVYSNRPSPATRLQLFDEANSGNPDEPEDDNTIYLLNTPGTGLTTSDPSNGSVSFPGGNTFAKALQAAETDIAIRATQSSDVWSVRVVPDRIYSEGDRVRIRGNKFVVLSVTETMEIQGRDTVKAAFWELTLGRLLAPPVTVRSIEQGGNGGGVPAIPGSV